MARYHTEEEIRRYDLMKLGVLLLLLLLLALAWLATRDQPGTDLAGVETVGTPVDAGLATDESSMPLPTLAIPSVNIPAAALAPGSVTLNGTAGPGAQVMLLVDGQPAGAAITSVNGQWSATVDLPVGEHTVQANTVDNVGTIVGQSEPVTITVGDTADAPASAVLAQPGFDALSGTYTFTGTAAPGDTITIASNGMIVGSAVADAGGNFAVPVAADAITGEVQMQATDATGTITQQSAPLKLNTRPPSLDPAAELRADPETGTVALASSPDGLTLTGRGEPGTQVEALIDGVRAGRAVVDSSGSWSLPLTIPQGTHTLQFNTLDPGGTILASATPLTVMVGEGASDATPPAVSSYDTIAGLLADRAEFSTLLSVLDTTGLTETLTEQGPFTVFAPSNAAFEALPPSVIDGLLANPPILAQLLQYHVTRGRYLAADLAVVQPATVNGRLLTITQSGEGLAVNDALVTSTDLVAGNGIVHAIDRILVPPLAEGVRPPVIDASGVPTFAGTFLTIVGTAEPNLTILVELNGEPFGQPAVTTAAGTWSVSGDVTPGDYQIVAYMLDASGGLAAISRPVNLQVR